MTEVEPDKSMSIFFDPTPVVPLCDLHDTYLVWRAVVLTCGDEEVAGDAV
jgi:hypothetical protein